MEEHLKLLPSGSPTSVVEGAVLLHRFRLTCLLFSVYAGRVALPHAWSSSVYYPVLSPLYRQQEHWSADPNAHLAIVAHVGCGIVAMLAIVLQLSPTLRAYRPGMHRWIGRVYVMAGGCTVLSLRWLRAHSGAGSAVHGDPRMPAVIDATSAAWVAATMGGLVARWRGDTRWHGRLMLFSSMLAASPILQRLLNALLLCPAAMATRCVLCLVYWQEPPWQARWGEPGSAHSLLVGQSARLPLSPQPSDPRVSPKVLMSLDGYGEAEQAAFGLSALLALVVVLGMGLRYATAPDEWRRAALGGDDDKALKTPCELEPWTRLARAPFEIARRVAGRLAGCFSRCVGSRQLTRALAALIWLTLVAAFMVLLVGLIAMAGVAVFAFCFVLAIGTSFVVTLPLCLVLGGTAAGQG